MRKNHPIQLSTPTHRNAEYHAPTLGRENKKGNTLTILTFQNMTGSHSGSPPRSWARLLSGGREASQAARTRERPAAARERDPAAGLSVFRLCEHIGDDDPGSRDSATAGSGDAGVHGRAANQLWVADLTYIAVTDAGVGSEAVFARHPSGEPWG